MARAPQLDELIKSFSAPALGLVKAGPQGVGLHPALFDAFMDEPRLVLQARRKGLRVACPRVEDSPASRRVLDRIAEDDDAIEQAHRLLMGEVEDLVLSDLRLLHLLPHVPRLPLASVSALHEPTDRHRRLDVARWLAATGKSGAFALNPFTGLIDRGTYGDFNGRPSPTSPFLMAWLGRSRAHFAALQGDEP